MNKANFFKIRVYFTGIVAIAIWALLAWNHYHGGVPIHHILANDELPAISNWWGAFLLPLLTWFLMYRIHTRAFLKGHSDAPNFLLSLLYGFAGSLVFGILLSTFFTLGYPDLPGYMILGLLAIAFFFPIYRAECLLGFVLGMTFTFGAVLPMGVGTILGLVGLVLYHIRGAIVHVGSNVALMFK